MGYLEWFETHAKKHKKIVEKLNKLNNNEIINYFRFENMVQYEKDFCPLYEKNKKCHDIEVLNCYLCGCPYFRFDDSEPVYKSSCSIDAKDGKKLESFGVVHQDCGGCLLPHKESFIKKVFDRDWKKMMNKVKKIK